MEGGRKMSKKRSNLGPPNERPLPLPSLEERFKLEVKHILPVYISDATTSHGETEKQDKIINLMYAGGYDYVETLFLHGNVAVLRFKQRDA